MIIQTRLLRWLDAAGMSSTTTPVPHPAAVACAWCGV